MKWIAATFLLAAVANSSAADTQCIGVTDDGVSVSGECIEGEFEGYTDAGKIFNGKCEEDGKFDATSSEGDHAEGGCGTTVGGEAP